MSTPSYSWGQRSCVACPKSQAGKQWAGAAPRATFRVVPIHSVPIHQGLRSFPILPWPPPCGVDVIPHEPHSARGHVHSLWLRVSPSSHSLAAHGATALPAGWGKHRSTLLAACPRRGHSQAVCLLLGSSGTVCALAPLGSHSKGPQTG